MNGFIQAVKFEMDPRPRLEFRDDGGQGRILWKNLGEWREHEEID